MTIKAGDVYGRLTVLRESSERTKDRKTQWHCQCSCGEYTVARDYSLKKGLKKSCGCLQREGSRKRMTTHGLRYDPRYKLWLNMVNRCENENSPDFPGYGGRGIKVCGEWRSSPETFCNWVSDNGYKKGLQIDRRDNNGDYAPDNCWFTTNYLNAHNTRTLRSTNTSGYAGVSNKSPSGKFIARVANKYIGSRVYLGSFDSLEEAVQARNNFIILNDLPNKLQVILPQTIKEE